MKALAIVVIIARIGLGGLFVYAGIQKFIPKPPREQKQTKVEDPNAAKIGAFIGGMKKTGYFWPMLGTVELLAGAMLLSQVLALLGAVLLVPVTLNIFLFHYFLQPGDVPGLLLSLLYLATNLALIAYAYPSLKKVFLNFKLTNA